MDRYAAFACRRECPNPVADASGPPIVAARTEGADVKLIKTDVMSFIGPGSEWFRITVECHAETASSSPGNVSGREAWGDAGRQTVVPFGRSLAFRQARPEDPHQLRRRLRPDLCSGVRQVVLHGRVREAESVGRRLVRAGDEDRGDHSDFTVRGALGWAAGAAARHALRPNSSGVGGSDRRIVIGRSLVAGLSLSPRPQTSRYA